MRAISRSRVFTCGGFHFRHNLQLSFDSHLMEEVGNLILVFQQPIDGRLVVHRFVNRLRDSFTVRLKQNLVVNFGLGDTGVEPHRDDDSQFVRLTLRDIPSPNCIPIAPCAIAACTVPIRMFVYFSLLTVTLLTITVVGRT